MSAYVRPRIPGASIFLTVALADRGSDLPLREIGALREAVRRTMRERPFRVDARVVLPDHMHAVWTLPEGDSGYAVRMGAIQARFSMALRRSGFSPTPLPNPHGAIGGRVRAGLKPDLRGDEPRGNEAPIWQKRFWEHHIRDARDFAAHVRYCWFNPVKHGLVRHPGEWPYSSWHRDGEENP